MAGGVPQELIDQVVAKEEAIRSGNFRVDINEAQPAGAIVPDRVDVGAGRRGRPAWSSCAAVTKRFGEPGRQRRGRSQPAGR